MNVRYLCFKSYISDGAGAEELRQTLNSLLDKS